MTAALSAIFRPMLARRPAEYLGRLLDAWAGDIAHYFIRRAAVKTLRELNDRELRDIGLTRSQIEAAVHGIITLPDRRRM
jgi:uncharacterized protein YjiS (DUF1127 family)